MASDTILNKLWEIAQENNNEEIDEKSFKEDLCNSIYAELKSFSGEYANINNEFSRTLLIILTKTEMNPHILGETKGGEFKISPEIIVMAVKTIKYENQFIEGTPEYEKRQANRDINVDIKEIILTAVIIDKMLENYTELTYDEKESLIENYSNMTEEQQQAMLKNIKSGLKELEQKAQKSKNKEDAHRYSDIGKVVESIENIKKMLSSKDASIQEKALQILKRNKKFNDFLLEKGVSINSSVAVILNEYNSFTEDTVKNSGKVEAIGKYRQKIAEAMQEIKNDTTNLDKIKTILKENLNLLNDFLKKKGLKVEDLNLYNINDFIYHCSKKEVAISRGIIEGEREAFEELKQTNKEKNLYSENDGEQIANSIANNFKFDIPESEITDIGEQLVESISTNENFTVEKNNKQIIDEYTKYFKNLDEDDLQYLFDEIGKDDFIDTINQELNGIEDKETLNVMINATYLAKDLLKYSPNREEFFSKMDKIVDLSAQRNNSELIKDEEMVEIIKQAGVELQVGEIEQTVEYNEFFQEIDNVNSAPIEEVEAHKEFIEEHENFEIDPTWEEICRDAQAKGIELKGKALIELFEKYKEDIELLDSEKRVNAPSDRGEKAGNEEESRPDVSVSEKVEIQVEQDSLQGTSLEEQESIELSDEILEESQSGNKIEHFGKKGKNERIAVIEKDEQGNVNSVQVFKPIEFLRASNITFGQIEEQQQILTEIVKSQTQNKTVQIKQGENPVKEEDEDTRE